MSSLQSTSERADLLESLRRHRELFLLTVRDLSDEQARQSPTVSSLSLGGLVKHVASTEQQWAGFVIDGPAERSAVDWLSIDWSNPPPEVVAHQQSFQLLPDETLEGVLADYRAVASVTDRLVETVDLDASHPLPEAPWFEPGARWSARRVFLHIVAETSQHAGHADIIRETIDGQKSMG